MLRKAKNKDNDKEIPSFNRYDYSQTLTAFAESDKLPKNEIDTLLCCREYQLEAPLNNFNDRKLNDHLYVIYGTKKLETVEFM